MVWSRPWKLLEPTIDVVFEEGDVFNLKLYRLFCVISFSFNGVFANLEQVIKCYEDEISGSWCLLRCSWPETAE